MQLEPVEARVRRGARRATNCARTRSMSARVIARGTWLAGPYGTADGAISGQLPSGSGASASCQPSCVEPLGPAWPSWIAIFADVRACT